MGSAGVRLPLLALLVVFVASLVRPLFGRQLHQAQVTSYPCNIGDSFCFCSWKGAFGMFADPSTGCEKYYWCAGPSQSFYKSCSPGLKFNDGISACDWPSQVACTSNPTISAPAEPAPTANPPQTEAPASVPSNPQPVNPTPAPSNPTPSPTNPAPAPTNPTPAPSNPGSGVERYIGPQQWYEIFKHTNDPACYAIGFYTHAAFVEAARAFPGFANEADDATNKREVAAFLGQISHETTGGWPTAPDGPQAWGLCWKEENNGVVGSPYCVEPVVDNKWPCALGQSYHGRGPIQLSYNFNYGPAGKALQLDLLGNPGLVSSDPVIAFKTALWFWMTPQPPKPSPHDVMIGRHQPNAEDAAAGRTPGFGWTTNIINGGIECGFATPPQAEDRIKYFQRYAAILGVDTGSNMDCSSQRPYAG